MVTEIVMKVNVTDWWNAVYRCDYQTTDPLEILEFGGIPNNGIQDIVI